MEAQSSDVPGPERVDRRQREPARRAIVPSRCRRAGVTPGFVTTIGYTMFLGRDFRPEEGTLGKDQVVILS